MGSNPTRAIARTESEKKYMKYVDILELIKKEGGQPLPVWTTFAESESGYQNNGYVAIPNTHNMFISYLGNHLQIHMLSAWLINKKHQTLTFSKQ